MNKKILLTLILALVLSISCFASVVNAADALTATITSTEETTVDGDISVTITFSEAINTGKFTLSYPKNVVEYVGESKVYVGEDKANFADITKGDGELTISSFLQNIPSVTLKFKPVEGAKVGDKATFTIKSAEGTVITAGEEKEITSSVNATDTTTLVEKPTPTPTPTPTPDSTDETTPEPTNEVTPTLAPSKTGDGTAAEGPMPQTGVNVLAVSAIVLATIAAGYIARKTLKK